MATYCPNCNYKLRLRDYKPECPECSINLLFFNMQERLREDADKAEREHAMTVPKVDRIKASTIGNTLSRVRLGLYFLPILATLLPLGKITLSLPFYEKTTTLGAVSIVQAVSNFDFAALLTMIKSDLYGTEFLLLGISLIAFVVMLLQMIVQLGLLLISCSPKGLVRNFSMNFIGIALLLTSAFTYNAAATRLSLAFPDMISASITWWGVAVVLLAYLICIGTNIVHKVKGIEVKYRDVSELLMPYDERPSTIAANKQREEAVRLAEQKIAESKQELESKITSARAVNAVEDALDH